MSANNPDAFVKFLARQSGDARGFVVWVKLQPASGFDTAGFVACLTKWVERIGADAVVQPLGTDYVIVSADSLLRLQKRANKR